MDYKGRKFTDLTNGRVVEVKDYFEDVAVLDNNSRIKVARLLDKNFFDEYIDPQSFFKNDNLLNTFAQKIRQIPDDVIHNMNENSSNSPVDINNISGSTSIRPSFDEPAILQSDPELEKEELMRKYGIVDTKVNVVQNNTISAAQKQLETFKGLLEDIDVVTDDNIQKIEVNRNDIGEVVVNDIKSNVDKHETIKVDDPIISMFKNIKRNTDLKIELTIENKIPRADFIEMMEDSYNTSIIDFLAQEFTDNLLKNPDIIKQKIKDEINNIVYKYNKISDIPSVPLKKVEEKKVEEKKVVRRSRTVKKEQTK